jgi:hypothetical protein
MPREERRSIQLDGDERDRLETGWSRSGKRLIVTVWKRDQWAQVELEPAQVEELARFLAETVARAPADR